MATNSYIQVPPDGTGKKLYAQQHTVGADTVQTQVFHLSDPINPSQLQAVDARGQANVRFAEGSPSLDAFGNLRTSNARMLGAYEFTNGPMSDLFTDVTANGGTLTYVPTASEMLMSVTGASGSKAERTTNRYHYYQPGVGNLIIITMAHGDSGKANNIRYWGYGDDYNGLFFRLNGTTLEVVIRSNVTGVMVENIVTQPNWNGDKLNGTGFSGLNIDVTKANFYWVDYAWLGVGTVRFGVLAEDGSRTTCHTFENPNNNLGPYMATGSLPLHFEMYNTALASGSSEMKLICSAVYSESDLDYTFWRFSDAESTALKSIPSTTVPTPVVSLRSKLTYNGKTNRVGLYPQCLSIYVSGGPIKLVIYDDVTLTGASWQDCAETAQYDNSSSAMSDGSKFHTYYFDAGSHYIDVTNVYETNDEGYCVLFDGSGSYTMTLGVTKLNSGDTVTCTATINYRELR